MPAVSVRDIQVKDDNTCLCSDLVAGTHGRGFWILDNVTPLRQLAEAQAATSAYLFEPATAVRVRFGMNDPTEWTPELPHGENPPPGGIIDYYLAADVDWARDAGDPGRGRARWCAPVQRRPGARARSGARSRGIRPDLPARTPRRPNCRVPLYWPAPQMVLSTREGDAPLLLGPPLRAHRGRAAGGRRRHRRRARPHLSVGGSAVGASRASTRSASPSAASSTPSPSRSVSIRG